MATTGKVKKYEIALFLNTGTASEAAYTRIKKSTELKLDFGAKTEEYDYIADENPTTELEKYQPEIKGLPLTMYRDEDDFKALWDYAYNLKIGGDAVTDMLLVYKFDEDATNTGKWKAWRAGCAVVVTDMDAVDGKLTFDLPFRGTIEKGTVVETSGKPVFTAQTASSK